MEPEPTVIDVMRQGFSSTATTTLPLNLFHPPIEFWVKTVRPGEILEVVHELVSE